MRDKENTILKSPKNKSLIEKNNLDQEIFEIHFKHHYNELANLFGNIIDLKSNASKDTNNLIKNVNLNNRNQSVFNTDKRMSIDQNSLVSVSKLRRKSFFKNLLNPHLEENLNINNENLTMIPSEEKRFLHSEENKILTTNNNQNDFNEFNDNFNNNIDLIQLKSLNENKSFFINQENKQKQKLRLKKRLRKH